MEPGYKQTNKTFFEEMEIGTLNSRVHFHIKGAPLHRSVTSTMNADSHSRRCLTQLDAAYTSKGYVNKIHTWKRTRCHLVSMFHNTRA